MSRSVAEVRQSLEESQHKMAVWEMVIDYLSARLDTEAREAQTKIIHGKGQAVPQELIAGIIQDIEAEKVSPLREDIHALENLQVVETKNDKQGEKPAAPRAQPKNPKRVRVLAQPG